ncbi:hypothetical protein [Streptomyces sp. NPDC051569]|uniref:hypothetical protein n=1 Tax=Streptomyces sp. NPDC051569 TaxID=3365661 RepID=UPI0037B98A30
MRLSASSVQLVLSLSFSAALLVPAYSQAVSSTGGGEGRTVATAQVHSVTPSPDGGDDDTSWGG